MAKTKRNWLLTGLLVFAMMFGLCLGFGLNNSQVQTVYANGLEDIAGSELQVKTLKLNKSQSDCTVTFADGRYLHLNPDTNITVVNNISDGADMEYYNGVLKFYIKDNDDFNEYIRYKMSVYALNSTDKQLTVAVDSSINFDNFDYPKGDLTVTTLDSVNHSVSFWNAFYTTGTVTVNGYAYLDVISINSNSSYTSTFEAGALQVLDNASFRAETYSNEDSYAVKVTNLTINTNGSFTINARKDGHISALKVDAGTITLTKCHLLEIYSKTQSSDRSKVTNVTSLRNPPETPIDGFYATYVDDYDDGLHLDVVPEQALHTVSFNSNGGSGTMAAVENVYYSYKTPACTFTAPEGKKFGRWSIGAPDGPTVNSGSTTEITQDITLYANWKNTVPSNTELRMGNTFGSRPSSSSYDDVNGVLTLSSNTNCNITVNSTSGRSDLTIVFDGVHEYGYSGNESNYLFIKNTYGDITLTSETPVTVYACIMTYGSLIVKGKVHLVPTGLPNTEWRLLSLDVDDNGIGYGVALLTASQKISVLENASITAIDPYIISVYHNNSSILRAKYYEFDTTGEVEIGTKTQVYGSRYNSAICFLDTTDFNSYREIIGRMTIKRCGQDGCLKLYRYYDSSYTFVATKKLGFSHLGVPPYDYLHFNRNISAYTEGGVDAELMTLKPCIVTFDAGEGTGTMATDYTTVKEDYTLPACTFTAPDGKHFAGWSINGSDPVNANTTYAVPDQTASLTLTAVWNSDIEDLSGTVTITGSLKYGKTLSANVTETNNTGTLNYQWRRNGMDIAEATNNTYTLTQDDIGYTISVVVSSNVETGSLVATATETVAKADGPVAPTGITATACTTNANNNGTITGLTTAMQYKLSTSEIWLDVENTTITGLANGTYNVRYKETATHKASEYATVVVNAYNAPTQYSITVNYGTVSTNVATAGTIITLTANDAEEGYEFDKWVGEGVIFEDKNNITTSFVMPSDNVTITATYKPITIEPVYPDPVVEPKPENNGLSAGAVVGIVLASLAVLGGAGFCVYYFVIRKKKNSK